MISNQIENKIKVDESRIGVFCIVDSSRPLRSKDMIAGAVKEYEDRYRYARSMAMASRFVNDAVLSPEEESLTETDAKRMSQDIKIMDKKYGRKSLQIKDDFDVGMVNGKYWALNWVIGKSMDFYNLDSKNVKRTYEFSSMSGSLSLPLLLKRFGKRDQVKSKDIIVQTAEEFWTHICYEHKLVLLEKIKNPELVKYLPQVMGIMAKGYGKKTLSPTNEYVWGLINGKLSALNWVLGQPWDTGVHGKKVHYADDSRVLLAKVNK